MEYEIRPLTVADWQDVRRIFAFAMAEGTSTFRTDCPEWREWDPAHLSDCRFVITVDKKVAGWCAISPISTIEAYWGTVEESIYIDAAYRGRGLGRALLSHLCEESESFGYWSLYAVIFSANTACIHLHEQCGFRVIGTRERVARDRFGRWLDTTLMERRSKRI